MMENIWYFVIGIINWVLWYKLLEMLFPRLFGGWYAKEYYKRKGMSLIQSEMLEDISKRLKLKKNLDGFEDDLEDIKKRYEK